MAYIIEKKEDFFEVRISGKTSKFEILKVIWELDRKDRGKKFADLWLVAAESQVPFVEFSYIARAIQYFFPRGTVGNKTALVAVDDFQKAQMEMYRSEASILPFEMRVFRSRDEAVEWIRSPEGPTTSPQ